MATIVIIEGHQYDITNFIPNHPGENEKKNRSIQNYNNQDITELFQRKHAKAKRQEAFAILEEARKRGEFCGIKYLGPNKLE